ncbi:MAG: PolC-type DNA polymerase III, partial [Bacillota bacterium]
NPALDTLQLARALVPELKSYKLNKLADFFNKNLENHHRALDDARVTGKVLLELLNRAQQKEISQLGEINDLTKDIDHTKLHPHHTTILAQNKQGLKNLYKLVSHSHIESFHRVPRIPKSELMEKRQGLLVGSACESGRLFRAVMQGKPDKELLNLASFYDYLEIQPLGNNQFLVRKGEVESEEELKEINRKIYELGLEIGIPVIAAGDVHFLEPEDKIYRRILMEGQGFDDAAEQAPLYFRTTEEMLAEFEYFPEKTARELVIDNPHQLVEKIEDIEIIPDKLFTPEIEGADQKIRQIAHERAKEMYGEPLPEIVEKRLEKELESIIGNGYAVIYLTSRKLVKKSLEDGYLVGSRGSVGSSLAATMTEITEVNPLPPHYRCPDCKFSEFVTSGEVGVGSDLEDKDCPECGTELIKDGFDIPFEVFLGFEGDKVPDIDLNFSGEYQLKAHEYTEEIFGQDRVFRAGTISKLADRTAFGFVKGYVDDYNLQLRGAEMDRLIQGCTGVKKTTGQHPGGQIIVPEDLEIYDFTPIQRPANDQESEVLTTHFEFESIHDNLLKLDILGHDDPTSLKMLEDLTGVNPEDIPLDDPETMKIFSSTEPLGIDSKELGTEIGSLGIPEFGTGFVQQMLLETRPDTFAELIRISGLSHGTDVWLNNAQDLIKKGKAQLADVISVRDDIMNYLIDRGVDPATAFQIMEDVRHGAGLTSEQEECMRQQNVPSWYIESCKKIKYMFPKAHAAAYVMMAFRIAYFKVHYPREFYTVYFSIKSSDFDAQLACQEYDQVIQHKEKLEAKDNKTAKDYSTITVLEMVQEAMLRGVSFLCVDLYKSKRSRFQLTEEGLIPPLISLQGLGSSAAESIVAARQKEEFSSIEDLVNRTGVSTTVIEVMREHGTLEGMPESSQMSLFGN